MFRESGLYSSEKIESGINKWDKRHGSVTYGEKTIQNALQNFTPYKPPVKPQREQGGESKGEVENVQEAPQKAAQAPVVQAESVRDYIFKVMKGDLEHFQKFKDRKTGFSNLDAQTSLYPGLYVIGAISSLGKTTFAHQLSDQLAEKGDHVLYFSLEQTRLEMVSKGIARTTANLTLQEGFKGALSAIDIRRGNVNETASKALKIYADKAATETVIECGFDTTIGTIVDTVSEYVKSHEVKPVVVVDYLQIIRPIDPRQTTKDAVDGHVRALKKLQTDNDLVVIVISSLNRQNYLTPVDFESFKESGGIEYTADVIWGLQLAYMNDELFAKDKDLKRKREAVKAAKLEVPRRVQLVCLKNRYGRSSYECNFDYYPQYDLFQPAYEGFTEVDDPDCPFTPKPGKRRI